LTYATNSPQWKQAVTPARKRGGQTLYSEEIAEEICQRIAAGESLVSIGADPRMPSDTTIERWGEIDSEERPGFSGRYARARERCLRRLADEALVIADKPCLFNGIPDNALVQQARLQIDTRKWYLSKLLPRQFGDKVTQELTGDPDRPLVTMIQLVPVPPKRLPKPDDEG
jgi:hypothetical protein